MTEKDLKKLNRQELLEVLLAQSKKIDRLQRQLNEANEKLNERELRISEAGSIAEASLVLNNIFADAQKAADQYLENIRLMHERAKAEYEKGELETIGADNAYEESAAFEAAELTEECGVEAAEAVALTEESALEAAEPVELTEESTDEASDIAEERAIEAERVAEKVWADRLAAAEAKAAAEADRKSAEEYLEEIRRKRVIGKPLDVVNMDEDGNVFVNGKLIDEPYIKEKALGECDIDFPYRVPEGSYFMIGDHRLTSIDSRSSSVGCISSDEIVGRIVMTVWPPKHMGISK